MSGAAARRAVLSARSIAKVAAVLVLAAAVVALSVVLRDRMIFFPDRRVAEPPRGVTERWITTPDGVRLNAWMAHASRLGASDPGRTADGPAPILLWSHGNAGNIADRVDVMLALAARGVDVLAYDYRGYGRSAGRPSERGVYRDATSVYDDLRARGAPASSIVCFGESLGGAVSIHLASQRPCTAVAVVATFTRLADVGRFHYGALGALAGRQFDSQSLLPSITVPLLVAHGERDEIVPFELGERLFAAASGPKRFVRVALAGHNDVLDRAELLDVIAAFAREATGASSTSGR